MDNELQEAINLAIKECKNPYALAYLNAIGESQELYGLRGLKTQLLYCLSNMSGWRGDNARKVKEVFKRYSR